MMGVTWVIGVMGVTGETSVMRASKEKEGEDVTMAGRGKIGLLSQRTLEGWDEQYNAGLPLVNIISIRVAQPAAAL